MSFTSSDEVATYLGGIFETGIVLEFDFSDPETHLFIDTTAGAVHNGREGAPEPAATMSMTADVGNAYRQGKVNLPMAMAKKKIKVEGNVASLLKLAPLSKKLFPTYIERLTADGRDDLLV